LPAAGLVDHRLLGDEDGHRGALRVVVLAGDVEDVGADDVRDLGQDLGQALGVEHLVDVLDVALALLLRHGVAHVVDVEAQGLGEVVETLEPQARQRLDHVVESGSEGGPALSGKGGPGEPRGGYRVPKGSDDRRCIAVTGCHGPKLSRIP
jgi:hypothetical protein